MSRRILLTGGAGYIGSHCCVALVQAGYDVEILDNFSNAHARATDAIDLLCGRHIPVHHGSITDPAFIAGVFGRSAFDGIVHFAARKSVADSVSDPIGYFETNIGGLINLTRSARAAGVRTLVFSSSATVYGAPDIVPTPETAPLMFENPYGFTKLTCEQMLQQIAASEDGWSLGILRYFNPVGAHPSGLIGDDPCGVPANLMPIIVKVASGELAELQVFGDDYDTPDGTGQRDYIHVSDLAEGHVRSLDALLSGKGSHLCNLGRGQATSVLEMIEAFEAATGKSVPYRIRPRRPGDVPCYLADVRAARDILGFTATRGLDEMCRSSWYWTEQQLGRNRAAD